MLPSFGKRFWPTIGSSLFWQEVVAVQILLARILLFAIKLGEVPNGFPEFAKFQVVS